MILCHGLCAIMLVGTPYMTNLCHQCPDVYEHFMRGASTSNETENPYYAIGVDHAHEQINAPVKGDG